MRVLNILRDLAALQRRGARAAARALCACALAGCALLWCTTAVAQTGADGEEEPPGRVALSGALAFGGFIPQYGSVTVLVEVVNNGPEATFELRMTSSGLVRRVDVDLAAGARRRMQVTTPVPGFGSIVLSLHDPGEEAQLARVSLPSRRVPYGSHVVAFIGARPPGLIRDLLVAGEGDEAQGFDVVEEVDVALLIAPSTVAELPESLEGYDPLSALFWSRPRPDLLSPAQAAALRRWVQGGGHLVVAVDEGWEVLSQGALGPLLPAQPGGVEVVESPARLRRLLKGVGENPDVDEPVGLPERLPLLTVTPKPGAVRGPESVVDDEALTWTWMVGDGRVTLWRTLPGRTLMKPGLLQWQDWLIGRTGGINRLSIWSATHHDEPKLDINVIGLLLVLLIYLAIIGPIDFFVLRRMRRLEWTVVTYPAAIGVFSLLAWLAMVSSVSSESVEVRYTMVNWPLKADAVQGWESPSKRTQEDMKVDVRVFHGFFPTRRRRVSFESVHEGDVVMPGEGEQMYSATVRPAKQTLTGTPALTGTLARYEAVAAAYAMTPVEVAMERSVERSPVSLVVDTMADEGWTLVVENHLAVDLTRCWAHLGGAGVASLFDVAAGGRSEVLKLKDGLEPSMGGIIEGYEPIDLMHRSIAGAMPRARLLASNAGGAGELICMGDVGEVLKVDFKAPSSDEKTRRGFVRFMF